MYTLSPDDVLTFVQRSINLHAHVLKKQRDYYAEVTRSTRYKLGGNWIMSSHITEGEDSSGWGILQSCPISKSIPTNQRLTASTTPNTSSFNSHAY